jgi:hypothetical protein
MSDYSKITDFTAKDALTTGDPEKIALGADVDAELAAIATMSATKEDEVNKGANNGYCGLDSGGLVARADLPSATSYTDTAETYTAGKGSTFVALTDAATIATNAALGNNFKVTLAGNRTMGAPTNLRDGQVLSYRVTQDATGSRTLAWASLFKWPSGTAPTLTTPAAGRDIFVGQYEAASGFIDMNTFGLAFA